MCTAPWTVELQSAPDTTVRRLVFNRICLKGHVLQAEVQRQTQQRRQQQLESARRSSSLVWRLILQGWLKGAYAFADHTRNALILSVFAFKVSCNCCCSDCLHHDFEQA